MLKEYEQQENETNEEYLERMGINPKEEENLIVDEADLEADLNGNIKEG
ncbi:MAG: hypothetical protein KGV57_02225 [Fusobacterium sp.]|nr:hypothetical protein [Fusobacterium sp.]